MGLDLFTLMGRVTVDTGSGEQGLVRVDNASKRTAKSLGEAEKAADSLSSSLDKTGGRARDAQGKFVSYTSAQKQAAEATLNHANVTGQLTSQLEQGLNVVRNFGVALTGLITLPMLAAASSATKLAGDLESSVASIQTIRPDFDGSRVFDGLSKMQTRVNQTSSDLGEASYQIVSSIDNIGEAATLNLTEKFGRGAAAARTEAGLFGKAIIGAMTQFETGVEGADHVMDVFFNTVNLGIVDGAELANEFAAVGKSAKVAGVDLDTLGGLIVGVTKEAGPASQNINDLANFLNKFKTKDAVAGFKALEVEVQKGGKYRPMLDILTEFKTKFDGLNQTSQAGLLHSMLPDAQAQRGLVTLLAQLDAVKASASENSTSSGSADRAFETVSKTFNFQAALMANTVRHVFEQIGAQILPVLTPIVKAIGEYLVTGIAAARTAWESLSPGVKSAAAGFAVFLAALGPVITVVAGVASAFVGLMGVVGSFGVASAIAVAAGTTLAAALLPIAVVSLKVIAVVGLLAVALGGAAALIAAAWTTNFGGIRELTARVFGAVKDYANDMMATLSALWQRVLPTLQSLTEKTLSGIARFWERHGEQIIGVVSGVWSLLTGIIRTAIGIIGNVIDLGLKIIDGDWKGAWEAFKNLVGDAMEGIGRIIRSAWDIIKNAVLFIAHAIAGLVTDFWNAAVELGNGFIDGFTSTVSDGGAGASSAVDQFLAGAVGNASPVAFGMELADRLKAGFSGAMSIDTSEWRAGMGTDWARPDGSGSVVDAGNSVPSGINKSGGMRNLGNLGGGGGRRGGGGGGGGESPAVKAAKLELEALKIVQGGLQRLYEQQTANQEFYFSNGLSGLASYVTTRKTLEKELYESQLRVANQELAVAQLTKGSAKERANAVAKALDTLKQINEQYQQNLTEIDRKSVAERLQISQTGWANETDRLEEAASGMATVYQRLAEQGVKSFVDAQQSIASSQLELLLREQRKLENLLGTFDPTSPQALDTLGKLETMMQRIANFRALMGLDDAESKRRDIQRAREWASQIREINESVVDMQMDTASQRLSAIEASTSNVLKAERTRLAFELQAENLRAQRERDSLVRQRENMALTLLNEQQRASVTEAINRKIVASDEAAYARRGALVEQFLNQQRERLRDISDTLADSLSDQIASGFEDGWRGALSGFKTLLDDMQRELLRSTMFKALKGIFNLGTAEDSKDGKAGTGTSGGILGALAKALGIGGLSPAETQSIQAVSTNTDATVGNTRAIESLSSRLAGGIGAASSGGASPFSGGLFDGLIGGLFNSGDSDNNSPDAVREAGTQAVTAVTAAGKANADAVKLTGDATATGLGNVSKNLLTGLGQIANMIAIGNQRGGFWSGLFQAAAVGFVNGLTGGILGGGGGGKGDGGVAGGTGGKFATGGAVWGTGTSTSDSIPAWLSNGEYVLKASAVNSLGTGFLDHLNSFGRMPPNTRSLALASGGYVNEGPAYIAPRVSTPYRAGGGQNGGRSDNNYNVIITPDREGRVRSRRQVRVEAVRSVEAARRDM